MLRFVTTSRACQRAWQCLRGSEPHVTAEQTSHRCERHVGEPCVSGLNCRNPNPFSGTILRPLRGCVLGCARCSGERLPQARSGPRLARTARPALRSSRAVFPDTPSQRASTWPMAKAVVTVVTAVE